MAALVGCICCTELVHAARAVVNRLGLYRGQPLQHALQTLWIHSHAQEWFIWCLVTQKQPKNREMKEQPYSLEWRKGCADSKPGQQEFPEVQSRKMNAQQKSKRQHTRISPSSRIINSFTWLFASSTATLGT